MTNSASWLESTEHAGNVQNKQNIVTPLISKRDTDKLTRNPINKWQDEASDIVKSIR